MNGASIAEIFLRFHTENVHFYFSKDGLTGILPAMRFRFFLSTAVLFGLAVTVLAAKKPNIVYIMSDELAYYELSHMGNPYIKTPNIDRFAAEGIRFTSALAGAPVCAPLRCNLMTGKHAGHALGSSERRRDAAAGWRTDNRLDAQGQLATRRAALASGDAAAGTRPVCRSEHGFDVVLRLLRPGARAFVFSAIPHSQQQGGEAGRQHRRPLGQNILALSDHGGGAEVHPCKQRRAVLLLLPDHAAARHVRHPE